MELVEKLRKEGFYAVRVPVSGSKSIPCDVLAARGEDRRAYQVKETSKSVVYISEKQVRRLLEFSRAFGLKAYVAVRWKGVKGYRWSIVEVKEPSSIKVQRPTLM